MYLSIGSRVLSFRDPYFPAFSWVLSLWLAGWLVVSRVCLLSRVSVSVRANKGGLLYVLTVYPAESWAPRVRAHEYCELSFGLIFTKCGI